MPFTSGNGSSREGSKREGGRLASRRALYFRLAQVGLPAPPLLEANNVLKGLIGDRLSPPASRLERRGASFSLAGQLADRFMANTLA